MIQERIAERRGRPKENNWVGQRIEDPIVDLAAIARAQGVAAGGPIEVVGELVPALERAFEIVESGEPRLIDVIVWQTQSASSFSGGGG